MKTQILCVVCVCILSGLIVSFAGVPELINYQGWLVQDDEPYTGDIGLTIRFYNVLTGGTKLYEHSNTVSVSDGVYSTVIGTNMIFGNSFNRCVN